MEIQTQGVKYAGSKKKLIPQILALVETTGARSVWDAFAGTTRVSQALAQCGYQTFCSDVSAWSEIFGTCWLLNTQPREAYAELIAHLNHIQPVDGWFSENYGGEEADAKRPFQRKNMRKLDGIRAEIDRLSLDRVTRAVVLTSLMLALDRVDSTLGHFSSYLRNWAPRSYSDLRLEVPHLWVNQAGNDENETGNAVFRGDVFSLMPKIHADLAYFDPPYGSNNEKMPPSRVRYAAYYHFWTTLVQNDRPDLFGVAQRRKDSSDLHSASVFEDFRKNPDTGRFLAVDAIQKMLEQVNARWILLSYSSGGRATAEELFDVVRSVGELRTLQKIDYRRNVMANMTWTNEWLRDECVRNQEYLFLIKKDDG